MMMMMVMIYDKMMMTMTGALGDGSMIRRGANSHAKTAASSAVRRGVSCSGARLAALLGSQGSRLESHWVQEEVAQRSFSELPNLLAALPASIPGHAEQALQWASLAPEFLFVARAAGHLAPAE